MRKHRKSGEAKPPRKIPDVLGAVPPPQKIFAIVGSKILLTTKKMLTNKEGIKTSVRISRDITVTNSGKDTRLPNNVMANRFPTIPVSASRFSNFFVFQKTSFSAMFLFMRENILSKY